jgi:hypothetical protein
VNRDVYDMISRYKEMLREENFRQVNQLWCLLHEESLQLLGKL